MGTEPRPIEVMASEWNALAPHHQRGALFLLDVDLDVRAVAEAIAGDRRIEVEALVGSGRLRRPTQDEERLFAASPETHRFRFAIVQPYIVAQRLGDGDA
jgi:hypothetical protein